MDYQSFIHFLSELFIFDDDVVDDEDLIFWIMSLGVPSLFSVHLMKDRGNSLFNQGNTSLAGKLYKQALNFMCYVGLLPSCDQHATSSLAISLVLNLAACELKLSHYDLASRYCQFVLHFDADNVKALYRRGLASKQLNLLTNAHEDFKHVLHLDPKNSQATRELLAVVDKLAMNPNGKRVVSPVDPLGSDKKGKKPLLSYDVADKSISASCSSSCRTESISSDVNSGQDSMILDSTCEADPPPVAESAVSSSHFLHEKSVKYSFTSKRQAKNQLHISLQDYENLLGGKDLSFFHAGSMSFMRVRPLIPENSIQTGTPHEDISRAAEVPPPFPKEQVEHSTSILKDGKIVQEEVVLQIAKKKRISSDSVQVSKFSVVQFQFVAVGDSKGKSCRRQAAYSRRCSQVTQARKRTSSVTMDFSPLICRYSKENVVAIRSKRKEMALFSFDNFCHHPQKKCRLTVSTSISCTVSSASWLCSSLKDSGTPGFVM